MYRRDFHSLVDTGKNCYYSMMSRETMDWRTLLLRMCIRFFAIWVHPEKMFFEQITRNGKTFNRFTEIDR